MAGRSTAAIIIKSLAEAGRPADSAVWESWARGLIGCLNKPDPWEVKRIYLIATARIFLLAQGSQTIQREVTTPLLPPLITACLAAVKPITAKNGKKTTVVTSPLLPTVLKIWNELLQDHSATFRPFVSRIKPICLSLISDSSSSTDLCHTASELLASLHACAPKASATAEWQLTISNCVKACHDSLDLVLRGVREEWSSNDSAQVRSSIRHDYSREPEITQNDTAALGTWKGVHQGIVRVCSILEYIVEMFRCQSSCVAVPLGLLLDLTARIGAMTVPKQSDNVQSHLRTNPEVAKEERETLWADLPMLHVICLKLVSEMVKTHNSSISTLIGPISEQVFDIFLAEAWHEEVRSQCYSCLSTILQTNSCTSLELDRQGIEAVCKACCRDLSGSLPQLSEQNGASEMAPRVQNSSSILQSKSQGSKSTHASTQVVSQVVHNAYVLLPMFVEKMPSSALSHGSRTELDRLSILLNHESAMAASVMNPPKQKAGQRVLPSILPFFARAGVEDNMVLEAIMKPRMPAISEPLRPELRDASPEITLEQPRDHSEMMIDQPEEGPETMKTPAENEHPVSSLYLEPPSQDMILGKRDFEGLAEAPTTSSAWKAETKGLFGDSKRLRTEDHENSKTQGVILKEQPSIVNGGGRQGSINVEANHSKLPQFETEKPVVYGETHATPMHGDSDIDSDIPEIDPHLATDDEFEDEDEEEEVE